MQQLRIGVVFFALFFFPPESAIAQAPTTNAESARVNRQADDGTLPFYAGLFFAYDGQHARAQKQFLIYQNAHPDDLLVASRIFLDQWVTVRKPGDGRKKRLSAREYRALLKILNRAIAVYD